jgi:RNA polymerase sigma-70 factor (ECF subfamily)
VGPFERAIYLAALAFVYDPDEAVEVAQESVLHAFRSLPDATTTEQLRSRLIDIVIDKAKAFLRERKQVDCDDIAIEDEPDILDLVRCPLAQLVPISGNAMSPQEKREILSKTLGWLPRKFRVVLFLRDVLGFTTAETAHRLAISEDTIRKRLACARFGVFSSLRIVPRV